MIGLLRTKTRRVDIKEIAVNSSQWRYGIGIAFAAVVLAGTQHSFAQTPAAPLKVCIQEDNSPLSLKRRAGFTGFDIDLANALAAELKQPLKIIPFEAELEKEASIANDVNAMLTMGVCDLVSGYALYASALGAP
jgi:hypothetical protein